MKPKEVRDIVLAMVALDVARVKILLESHCFDATEPFVSSEDELQIPPHPFVTIPTAWDWYLVNIENWRNPQRGLELKARNEKIKEMLISKLGVDFSHIETEDLPHWKFLQDNIASEWYYLDEDDISDLVKQGFRKIDIELFNEAERLDFAKVEDLLCRGANPEVTFPEYESINETLASRSATDFCDLEYHYLDKPAKPERDEYILHSLLSGASIEHMWRYIQQNNKCNKKD